MKKLTWIFTVVVMITLTATTYAKDVGKSIAKLTQISQTVSPEFTVVVNLNVEKSVVKGNNAEPNSSSVAFAGISRTEKMNSFVAKTNETMLLVKSDAVVKNFEVGAICTILSDASDFLAVDTGQIENVANLSTKNYMVEANMVMSLSPKISPEMNTTIVDVTGKTKEANTSVDLIHKT